MAICSVEIEGGDTEQLTIVEAFTTEPFPLAKASGKLKVKDERGLRWTFKYKVKSSSKRIISGDWVKFVRSYGVGIGDRIRFERNTDGWGPEADYKIEVISGSS